MGTRHLIIVVYQGRWIVAQYGQFDGYPEYAGRNLVKILASKDFIHKLRDGLVHTYKVSFEEMIHLMDGVATERKQLDHRFAGLSADGELVRSPYGRFCAEPLDNYTPDLLAMHPSLARETSTAVLVLIAHATADKPIPLHLEVEFANDSLSCEWAYVVDLDSDVLEVYGGADRKTPEHRFINVGRPNASVPTYIATIPFAEMEDYDSGNKNFLEMISTEIKMVNHERGEENEIYFNYNHEQE